MSVLAKRMLAATGVASLMICGLGGTARAQTSTPAENAPNVLPETKVEVPKQAAKPEQKPRVVTREAAPAAPAPTAEQLQAAANRQVVQQTQNFDQRRDNVILPKIGTTNYELTQRDIENIPQANAIQFNDLALQFPGVSQDSTSSGDFHVRNEHANVQYRINGILLPDGVSGFSQILETSFIGNMGLLTGALPAQYGLHTAGILDITTKSGTALSGGSVSVYGGSRQTITPSFEYGGVEGKTDYFVTGRYLSTGLGLENPISTLNAIHDHSEQGRFFAYTSTVLDIQRRGWSPFQVSARPVTRFPTIPGSLATWEAFAAVRSIPRTPASTRMAPPTRMLPPIRPSAKADSIRAPSMKTNTRRTPTTSSPGRNPKAISMRSSRIIRVTAIFTSFPTRWAISSSTTSHPMFTAARS